MKITWEKIVIKATDIDDRRCFRGDQPRTQDEETAAIIVALDKHLQQRDEQLTQELQAQFDNLAAWAENVKTCFEQVGTQFEKQEAFVKDISRILDKHLELITKVTG